MEIEIQYDFNCPMPERRKRKGRPNGIGNYIYRVVINNEHEHFCSNVSEIAMITSKSKSCISRILTGNIKYKTKRSVELANIKIEKIPKNNNNQ